jgi:hypothetical protein
MTTANPVTLSGQRLQQETIVFIQETGRAAEAFGKGVEKATSAYLGRLKTTGERFVSRSVEAAGTFGGAVEKEADFWRDLVVKTRDAYVDALRTRLGAVENSVSEARDAVRPDAVRVRALKTAQELIDSAKSAVDAQLAEVDAPKSPAPKAPPKRTPRKATPASRKANAGAPIRNYDQLTAKDVVARIQRLTPPQASALLDYEQGKKNRATVVRAAKQRAAAG